MSDGGKQSWGTAWSQNQVMRLTKMLKAGASFTEIGRALNRPKNAVAGKAHRLGLTNPGRSPIIRATDSKTKRAAALRTRKRAPKPRAPAGPAIDRVRSPRLPIAPSPEIKVKRGKPEENRMTPAAHPSTRAPRPSDAIWHPKTCQYPHGEPGTPDFHFCGAPITPDGRAYCDEHYARCYTKRPEKAPGEGGIQSFRQNGWGGYA
jgi:GcrA cell cycle regulator